MTKNSQQRFNEYLAECRETADAVNEFVNTSYENYTGYAHAAGALSVILNETISELPRAKREAMRARLYNLAQHQKNEILVKKLKAA